MTQPFPFETERHQDETAPSSVHPTDFYSTTDPALDAGNGVAAGKRWRKTDSLTTPTWFEVYIRNEANSAWILERAWANTAFTVGQVPVADASGRLAPTTLSLSGSFAPVVDVSGLAADGTTDDTTALNALIAANPDDVVFDGGGALYKITALDFPAMNRVTFRNWRFTVPGDTVPISASGLVYQCHFSDIFITAGSQSTSGRRIWDFTNFSNCVFRLIRTFGVDNISDHWYGTKNAGGSAPYYNRFEELYAGVGRYLVNCADAGSTATGPNANTWADCRFQPGARVAVCVMKFCQSLVFQNITIEGTGTGYEMNGRGCTIRGGYMEGLATNIHLDADSFGCVVDFPYFSTVGTKIDDDGTDNVIFGHRDDLGVVVDNVTGGGGGGDLMADGSVPMTGDLDLDGNAIVNVLDPVDPQDAATKQYVDDEIAGVGGGGLTQAYAGYNTAGGSFDTPGVNSKVYAKQITLANNCLITSIGAYVTSASGSSAGPKVALYSDNAGAPDKFLGGDGASGPLQNLNSTARWVDQPFGAWVVAGTYWIVVRTSDSIAAAVLCQLAYDATGSDRVASGSGAGWLDWSNYGGASVTGNQFSIRANTIR